MVLGMLVRIVGYVVIFVHTAAAGSYDVKGVSTMESLPIIVSVAIISPAQVLHN